MRVIFSSIRWPDELYKAVKELAYQNRESINKTVVKLVEEQIKNKQKSYSK